MSIDSSVSLLLVKLTRTENTCVRKVSQHNYREAEAKGDVYFKRTLHVRTHIYLYVFTYVTEIG